MIKGRAWYSRHLSLAPPLAASKLAEAFGKTIIHNFPARDLARHGVGGPVESHGLCLLLSDRGSCPGVCRRGLIDIDDRATHFTLIPSFQGGQRNDEGLTSHDIGVGYRLLSDLVARQGNHTLEIDCYQLATSGQVNPHLLDLWESEPAKGPLHWSPSGVSALPLVYCMDAAKLDRIPLADQLASAFEFLIRQVTDYVTRRIPPSQPIGELLLMGDGVRSGHLATAIAERLPFLPVRWMEELGEDRSLHSAAVAALAMLHVWHVPSAVSRGGEVRRVLGSLTPGSPSNWQRVLQEMHTSAPWLLPLREAI